MAFRQLVKTQKRVVFWVYDGSATIGLTASAFWDYSTPEGATAGEIAHINGNITGGSAALSKVVFTDGCTISNANTNTSAIFNCPSGRVGDLCFERFTIKTHPDAKSVTVNPNGGTTIVEFIL